MKKSFFSLLLFGISQFSNAQKEATLLVGTYTNGPSTGIYVYQFNLETGSAALIDSTKTVNPSFLAVSPNGKYVYAVNELGSDKGGGKVTAFALDKKTRRLTAINQQPSLGDHPCYITVDRKGKWVIAGNYSSGTLAVFPIAPDGGVGPSVVSLQHQGAGTNTVRQSSPHIHATVLTPDHDYLLVPDLGIDKVMVYSFSSKSGMLKHQKTSVKLMDGSGPRHLDFHPSGKWAYVVQELSGTVTGFRYHKGKLEEQQVISMLPADYKGTATAADIHVSPDGRFLYTSNRNTSNTIAIFSIDEKTGMLTLLGHQPTKGKAPRNFNFDPSGKFLLVANQESDAIIVFQIDPKTGLLTDTNQTIKVPNPVCIKWAVD